MKNQSLYQCDECIRKCKSTYQFQCEEKDSFWRFAEKYQITKKPEPVNYLDIPADLKVTVDSKLEQKNGSAVDLISETRPGIVEIKLNNGEYWNILLDWLKQKPAQPTVEELQDIKDELQKKIGIINKIADAVYANMAFTQHLPEKIKRILAGEE